MTGHKLFQEFSIVFDNPTATYFPGQLVTGHVKINTKRIIKTSGIYVRFLGSCYGNQNKSHLKQHNKLSIYKHHYDSLMSKENRGTGTQASYVYQTNDSVQRKFYKDTEVYFDIKNKLWGTERMEKFECGSFNLAFQFTLPSNLPTSYEGDRGYVRYIIMATISRPWNSPYRILQPFTVISVVDLNTIPGVEKPVAKHEERKFGFLIFKGGSIITNVGILKKGYVPGETIVINGDVLNNSMGRISKHIVHLVSVTTYRVSNHVLQTKQDLCQIEGVSIPSTSSWELKDIHLTIPPAPPSGLGGCGIITVDYRVQITLKSDFGNVEVNLPIIIGTIPLRTDFATMHAPSVKRKAPPRPPPPGMMQAANGETAPENFQLQAVANKRLAKEQEALGNYESSVGVSSPTSTDGPPSFDLDLLTGDLACANVSEDNTAPLVEISQITSTAVSEMYPDLPPPSYEECMYGERISISDNDAEDSDEGEHKENGSQDPLPSTSTAPANVSNYQRHNRYSFAPCYVYYHQTQNNANS